MNLSKPFKTFQKNKRLGQTMYIRRIMHENKQIMVSENERATFAIGMNDPNE
jgi:hypothetical protein